MAAEADSQLYVASKDFSRIVDAERKHLSLATSDESFGLALSGGGIRSASFAMGVLQALYGYNVFKKFHYLSTVSGGGYVGSALTYFRHLFVFEDPARFGDRLDWFPFGYVGADGKPLPQTVGARAELPTLDTESNVRVRQIVNFIRQHASFLVPSRQLNTAALVVGALHGLVSTAIPYFTILVGVLALMISLGLFDADGNAPHLLKIGTKQPELTAVDLDTCPPGPCQSIEPDPPSPYLASWPASVSIWLLAGMAAMSLLTSMASGLAKVSELFVWIARFKLAKDLGRVLGYRAIIKFYSWGGVALVATAGLMSLSTLPWVHDYLDFLLGSTTNAKLPANFAALFSAIAGAAGLLGTVRNILGGKPSAPSTLRNLGLVVAALAFVYGILLLAYGIADDFLKSNQLLAGAVLGLGLLVAALIKVNHAAQHRLYRDRLMEVFCADRTALESGQWRPALEAQDEAGLVRKMTGRTTPYHLINTCLVTTDSDDRRFRGRGGDNFILSPIYCGSDATGWVDTTVAMPRLSIATAAAISGAAVNAHTGPHGRGLLRRKAYAALLSFAGLQLGYWARNPARYADTTRAGMSRGFWAKVGRWCRSKMPKSTGEESVRYDGAPSFAFPNLLIPGLFSLSGIKLNENGPYVQLSDGGHFENLAIYELVRRKVDFLWVSDAGQDSGFSFEDLSSAIERVRVDFGVNIRFRHDDHDLSHLIPGSAKSDNAAGESSNERHRLSARGYAIGTIEYPDGKKGVIVYVKTTLTPGLPGDLYGYRARNADYPHQTTVDQFFDEEQFEAYRELGYRLTAQLFRDVAKKRAMREATDGTTWSEALDSVAEKLGI